MIEENIIKYGKYIEEHAFEEDGAGGGGHNYNDEDEDGVEGVENIKEEISF